MVRIRMTRMGRTHRPFYRINAVEKRTQRDGKVLENLGWYNPMEKDEAKQVSLKDDRIKHWLDQGAQPSDTVANLFASRGLIDAAAREAVLVSRRTKKQKGIEEARVAAEASAKAEAEAKAREEAEAKAAAEAEAAAAATEGEGGESAEEEKGE